MEAGGTDCIIVFDLVDYEFILILQLLATFLAFA